MTAITVVNNLKDRSKTMRRTDSGTYEYGWLCYNRRDRSKDYFNKLGEGTYDDALQWISEVGFAQKVAPLFPISSRY